MENRAGIIYKATSPSGKVYIGQTICTFERRRKQHYASANNPNDKLYNSKFYRAIRKYQDKLKWKVIHKDIPYDTLNKLERLEISKHNSYRTGYNSDLGGNTRTTAQLKKAASRGEKHWSAKLNYKLVEQIRAMYNTGEYTYKDISNKLNNAVTPETVGKIVRNERWASKLNKYKIATYKGHGARNSHAKLTLEKVREIRAKHLTGKYNHPELAKEYGVNAPAIFKIIHNITWKE